MSARRDILPWLIKLAEGQTPKEIAYEEGLGLRVVNFHLHEYVKEGGYRNRMEAIVKFRKCLPGHKPPDAVD